jgi:putative CocE/NonD family hydrolase
MATIHPHPALKVAIAQNPMVDGWMGDDWFHYGAFRQPNAEFIYTEETTHDSSNRWWTSDYDTYEEFLEAGSAGELGKSRGLDHLGFWQKILTHPSYDKFWQDQAVDKIMAREPLAIPIMLVQSLWDQEDIYGANAVYRAIKPKDIDNSKVFLVIGPWCHGQEIADAGTSLGAIKFHSETAAYYRNEILRPFLDSYLKDESHDSEISPVNAFETGTNIWRRLRKWPSGCDDGCNVKFTPIYLGANHTLDFDPPQANDKVFDEYTSDPSKPIPFQSRPIPTGDFGGNGWPHWLVDDQRNITTRPDVVSYLSSPLSKPLKISGQAMVHLTASTSGTDSDWVVKLIDVFPSDVADQAEMGGYQLMVAADIFRGRYRRSFESPTALEPNSPLLYTFALPTVNHVFLPGHRLMVQVQSSWFPLYDRNPQSFVPNIFLAEPKDYQKAVQRIYHSRNFPSNISLPLVSP